MKYQQFLSRRALRRTPSPIRAIFPLSQLPGMLSLAGGLPHPDTFPITGMTLKLSDGSDVSIAPNDLKAALQYCPSYGLGPLLDELTSLMAKRHSPIREGWKICVGTGSQDVLGKAFDMLLNEGDPILVEEACYPGVLSCLQVYDPKLVPVAGDDKGITAEALDQAMTEWKGKKPRVIYMCPTGQNPAGTTMTTERKEAVYRVCQKHDLMILEDDPYYFLYFGEESNRKSFFSMDVDGRVLRFDSFSKVLSAGMRIGWVTGPSELIDQIQLDMQTQALNVSGLSQVVAATVLRNFGDAGLDEHLQRVCSLYKGRRNSLMSSCEKHLGDLVSYNIPNAGMFLWMKLRTIADTEALVMEHAQKEKVLFVPGKAFSPNKSIPSPFVRASYSTIKESDMDEAMHRLRKLIDSN
eukprot:PhM_4_TR10170/c0_g1_i1/m.4188/K00825/AADAT, KAT2; kynurenine/2-aminoadipate aminotransferase